MSAPCHTRPVFSAALFPGVVDWCVATLREMPGLQAVAGCGHSGLLVAGAVAYMLRLPVIAVRKGEFAHDSLRVNAELGLQNDAPFEYAIIDDLVSSGNTIRRITAEILADYPGAKPCAVLLYNDWCPSSTKSILDGIVPGVPLHIRPQPVGEP